MNNSLKDLYALPVPANARGFFDPVKTNKWLRENTLTSFNHALNKIETPDFKLKVTDLTVDDNAKFNSLKMQKQALMDKQDMTSPVRGNFQLINKKTGEVVEEKKTIVAHIPYITQRGTVILNGSEYINSCQQRLKPGIFTRLTSSGQVEAHVNVASGTGLGGKIIFDPEKAVFTFHVGTTGIKLYGLLHDLGVSDEQMKQAWGDEIWLKNKQTYDGLELEKYYSKIFKYD